MGRGADYTLGRYERDKRFIAAADQNGLSRLSRFSTDEETLRQQRNLIRRHGYSHLYIAKGRKVALADAKPERIHGTFLSIYEQAQKDTTRYGPILDLVAQMPARASPNHYPNLVARIQEGWSAMDERDRPRIERVLSPYLPKETPPQAEHQLESAQGLLFTFVQYCGDGPVSVRPLPWEKEAR